MPWLNDATLPSEDADPFEWLLFTQERVLTRAQALAHLSPGAVRHRLASGRWQAGHRGVYVADSGAFTRAQQLWVAVLANGSGALLAGTAAAIESGLRRPPGPVLDVVVPAGARPQQPGRSVLARSSRMPPVVVHRTSRLPEVDVHRNGRPPRTTPPRSLVDAAQWAANDDAARALVAGGCRQQLVTPEQLLAVVDRLPRARRRSVVLETIGFTTDGSQALSEINFVKLCRRHGFPPPDQQVMRTDAAGRLRFLDARWRRYRVVAEVDGGYHLEPEAWWADMWRQNDLWIDDEIVVRFPAWAVRHHGDRVADQLGRALRRGGWTPF